MKKRWTNIAKPMRTLFLRIATTFTFGLRKSGLGKLQNDVRSCEYEDVHVMWEMLNREAQVSHASDDKKNKCHWKLINLARNANLCRNC